MILERHIKSAILLFTIVMLSLGCDSDQETYVTGALLYRNPGNLEQFTIIPDSIEVGVRYNAEIGGKNTSLAGTYENVSAFSLYKFSKPGQSIIDSLVSATITFSLNGVWRDGPLAFAIYNTTAEWEDSTDIDPGLFLDLGAPISEIDISSEVDSLISKLTFEIDKEYIDSWSDFGAILLKNTDTGGGMINMSSDNSSSSPALTFIRSISGVMDTSTVRSREGTYSIETGVEPDKNLVADGAASGFVLDIGLAYFNPSPTSIHRCILNLTVTESIITGSSMPILVQLLTSEFTTIEDATTDYGSSIDLDIVPGVSTYSVDISKFIEAWHNFDINDYGILIKPFYSNNSPNYIVIEPADSLVIEYTTLPEVE
ncbi:hypothetical protein ACFL50_02700 [Candidatus Latescibacterota bacterium]